MAEPEYTMVESALVAWLQPLLNALDGRCATQAPGNPVALDEVLPFVQINRFGGPLLGPNLDKAFIDVDFYHRNRDDAEVFATKVRRMFYKQLTGTYQDHDGTRTVWGRIHEVSGLGWRTYDNPNIQRYGFTFSVIVQSLSTPS
jgi:hypothetical protein